MIAAPPRVLVVYFSRTGTTRRVAEEVARAARGELEELQTRGSRLGPWGWLRCGFEGTYQRAAKTLPLRHRLLDYDLVFVGTPTWNQALSGPVRGFLQAHRHELGDVALFATCAGRGADTAIEQMARLLEHPPLARLTMLEREVGRAPAASVRAFTESAVEAWDGRTPTRELFTAGGASA